MFISVSPQFQYLGMDTNLKKDNCHPGGTAKEVQKVKEFQAAANISRNTDTPLLAATPSAPPPTVSFCSRNPRIHMCDFDGKGQIFFKYLDDTWCCRGYGKIVILIHPWWDYKLLQSFEGKFKMCMFFETTFSLTRIYHTKIMGALKINVKNVHFSTIYNSEQL